ncbi:mechanosensitive ion channel domain-containing protein [Moorena producens]|uniref:mechanosensitive ion channel domain-containing protein n=1 Tax=Moorena producens TaxID=1155739 RepID=UPI003C73405C
MTAKNLTILGLTGLLLLAYTFVSSNPDLVSDSIVKYLQITVLVCGSVVIVNFLSFLVVDVWFARSQGKQPSALLKLVISLFFYAVCSILILELLGENIAAFFTTSALITALIGFALQSTLGNFFSGVALRIDQPFQIGDRVIIRDVEGVIESITWRSIAIRQCTGEMTYIPNGLLSDDLLTVIPTKTSTVQPVMRSVEFLVPAASPPQQVIDTAYGAVLNQPHPNINLDKPIQVRMWEYDLADPGLFITYKLLYFPKNYNIAPLHTDRELLRRVWYGLRREGLSPRYIIPSNKQHLKLLSSIEFFRHFSLGAQKILIECAKPLLFDAGETLSSKNLPQNAMFIVVKGCLEVEQQVVMTLGKTTVKAFSHRPKAQPPAPLDQQVIERLAYQLAHYIGPTAFSVAHEAAQQTSSLYWLYQLLAAEIHDLEQRQEFLNYCPPFPVEQLQAGDFFGEMTLFLGKPLPTVTITAAMETEILVITQESLTEALRDDQTLLDPLSQQVAKHQSNYLAGTMQMSSLEVLSADAIAKQIGHLISA